MADIKDGYGLPDSLPALRLPSDADLAREARGVPLVRELAALAGGDSQGIEPARLRVLRKYAGAVGWTEAGSGETGSGGDDSDALDAWASAFAAVLSEAICASSGAENADHAEEPDGIDVHAPGAAVAMVLFLTRREGLFRSEARDLVRDVMSGEHPVPRTARTVEKWAAAHGEPADVLLGELDRAGAVTLPATDDGTIRFTPLALREMRNQLADGGIDIPLLPSSDTELTARQLLALAEGISVEEFEGQADSWLTAHGREAAAAELLSLAAETGPAQRLTAVSVVTRAGAAAEPAWRDHLGEPVLRPYAKVALASLAMGLIPQRPGYPGGLALLPDAVPGEGIPPELRPLDDDLAWMTTDVLSLACRDDDTDPDEIAAAFAQAVPSGQETEALDRVWRGPHPDAERVLTHVGRFHPDKAIAKDARRAARKAAGRRDES